MAATRSNRRTVRRAVRPAKRTRVVSRRPAAAAKAPVKTAGRAVAVPPVQVMFRFCKPGWAVIVEKTPHAQGTRFVCPFCTHSHRVSGPVRGFQKLHRPRWIKLRQVEE